MSDFDDNETSSGTASITVQYVNQPKQGRKNGSIKGKDGEKTVTIVGIDETDTAKGRISWISPVARALLKAREGDTVALRTPGGAERIEVLEVRYEPID